MLVKTTHNKVEVSKLDAPENKFWEISGNSFELSAISEDQKFLAIITNKLGEYIFNADIYLLPSGNHFDSLVSISEVINHDFHEIMLVKFSPDNKYLFITVTHPNLIISWNLENNSVITSDELPRQIESLEILGDIFYTLEGHHSPTVRKWLIRDNTLLSSVEAPVRASGLTGRGLREYSKDFKIIKSLPNESLLFLCLQQNLITPFLYDSNLTYQGSDFNKSFDNIKIARRGTYFSVDKSELILEIQPTVYLVLNLNSGLEIKYEIPYSIFLTTSTLIAVTRKYLIFMNQTDKSLLRFSRETQNTKIITNTERYPSYVFADFSPVQYLINKAVSLLPVINSIQMVRRRNSLALAPDIVRILIAKLISDEDSENLLVKKLANFLFEYSKNTSQSLTKEELRNRLSGIINSNK